MAPPFEQTLILDSQGLFFATSKKSVSSFGEEDF